jgi:hypothetical protein
MSMPQALDGVPRRVADWAVNRSLAPNSVAGISLALGICAAGWFSAGTRPDNIKGAIALLASYLAWRAARWLVGPAAGTAARTLRPGVGTLAELSGTLSDYVVYAGLAVGGYEAHWSGTWELAAAVVIAGAVRRTAVACGGQVPDAGDRNPVGSAFGGFLAFSPGGRTAAIVVVAPIWGAHATLLILLEWGIIATAYVITGHGPERVTVTGAAGRLRPAGRAEAAGAPIRLGSSTRAELPAGSELPARPELSARAGWSARADSAATASPSVRENSSARADEPVREVSSALAPAGSSETAMTLELMIHPEPDRPRDSKPKTVLAPEARATIAAYRDDGAAAVWLSRVVRGGFVPLPPAVAGLVATSFLAWLGMRNLPGVLLLTPLVVMLLAAFGSSHPHDGRLDWLVPAALMAGQLVYIAAIGFSFGVWTPVTFTLCALIALRYVDLARREGRDAGRAESRLGWEGRMLAAGVGAMLGIATVAYLALSVYVAVLVCGRVRTSVLAPVRAEKPKRRCSAR